MADAALRPVADPPLTPRGKVALTAYPVLMEEWDWEANIGIDPAHTACHSAAKRGWVCAVCGHCWLACPDKRVNGRGCPRQHLHYSNTLAEKFPEIAAEWAYDDPVNEGVTPWDIAPTHNNRRAWTCPLCGWRYWTSPANRTLLGGGCPQYRRHDGNTLGDRRPDLAAEWDHGAEENIGFTPFGVTPSSIAVRAWICAHCGERFTTSPFMRVQLGVGCPKRTLHERGSFSDLYPALAALWDYEALENEGVTPSDILPYHKIVRAWYHKECGYRWLGKPGYCVSQFLAYKSTCPRCDHYRVDELRETLGGLGDVLAMDGATFVAVLHQMEDVRPAGWRRLLIYAIRDKLVSREDYEAFLADQGESRWLYEKLLGSPEFRRLLVRPYIPPTLRTEILTADKRRCQLCSKKAKKLELDHFVPWVFGGPTDSSNLWTLCMPCNRSKSMRFPDRYMTQAWVDTGRSLPETYFAVLAADSIVAEMPVRDSATGRFISPAVPHIPSMRQLRQLSRKRARESVTIGSP